ncbi:MAG: hypothetical protein JRD68_01525 [Deltaproteobacteria bacterium]|nr:hypothetical protein [Deltaproteobacteria bacterium]
MTDNIASRQHGEERYSSFLLIVLILGTIILFAGYYWAVRERYWSWEIRGQFGNMFGGASAIFSALAFAALLFVILLQKHELGLQRHQLALTRDDLNLIRVEQARSSAAQEASAQATILREVFHRVDMTFQARQLVLKNFEVLSGLKNVEDLETLIHGDESLNDACQGVVSCYHYIGFLVKIDLLRYEKEYFEEASSHIWHMWVCLESYLKYERELQENEEYGRYFEELVGKVAKFEKRTLARS